MLEVLLRIVVGRSRTKDRLWKRREDLVAMIMMDEEEVYVWGSMQWQRLQQWWDSITTW